MSVTFKYKAIRTLREEPIRLTPVGGTPTEPLTALQSADGRVFPAQSDGDVAVAILTAEKGEELILTPADGSAIVGVDVTDSAEVHSLTVTVGSQLFSHYVYDPIYNKPYFGQILDGEGHPFTRLDFTTKEHPHHRSVFVGVGDVNGTDFWNEPITCGKVRNQKVDGIVSGKAFGRFTASNVWKTDAGVDVVRETTTYTVYNQKADCRYLDMTIRFDADFGDVHFGQTKEAGPLGIRVRDELRADKGTGRILNSYGAMTERECWGRAAHWCDYSGRIEVEPGKSEYMGILAFDNEKNERYPTTWHIRDYGLFAANNLYFKGGLDIPAGTSLTYRFRVAFYVGEMNPSEMAERFVVYVN